MPLVPSPHGRVVKPSLTRLRDPSSAVAYAGSPACGVSPRWGGRLASIHPTPTQTREKIDRPHRPALCSDHPMAAYGETAIGHLGAGITLSTEGTWHANHHREGTMSDTALDMAIAHDDLVARIAERVFDTHIFTV